jgi:archaellum biogenesis ATPase FlaH
MIMTKQNVNYGHEIQKVYLEMLLTDPQTFVRCQTIFNYKFFDKKLQAAAKYINEYVTDNNVLPKFEMVNAATGSDLKDPGTLREEHYDWLLSDFETFTRHKALEDAILKGADMLENGEYGAVEELVKKAVQIGLQKDLGTDYWNDPKARLAAIKDTNGQVSTGWKSLDDKLFGGFNRGELNIFAGGSGSGKSLFLANLGVNWALQGMNVLYLTFELSENLVSMRIDSMVSGIPSRDIFKNIDDVHTKVKIIGKKSGAMQVKYMPTGKNANDLRSYIKEYEIKTGRRLDVILVDYLDLMSPIGKAISAENLFVKDKYVSEQLRDLAMEMNTIFVSASQLNRSAVEEIEFDHSHISGGISKINTADNLIGIFTSRAMRERGRYQIQLMKTRNSSGVNSKIDLDFDVNTLRITDMEEGEGAPSKPGTQSSIAERIKRRSSQTATDFTDTTPEITEDSLAEGDSAPKVRAQTDSTQLRNFLNNLK